MSFYLLCPNCGRQIHWTTPTPMPLRAWDKEAEGTTLYFCDQKCRDAWEAKQKSPASGPVYEKVAEIEAMDNGLAQISGDYLITRERSLYRIYRIKG